MSQELPAFQLFNESEVEVPLTLEDLHAVAGLVAQHESCVFSLVEVVYVSEKEIKRINREYLDKSYVTDIITFHYGDDNNSIEGTLFCCAPRIYEQSEEYGQEVRAEFLRVMVHGLLHLSGYGDSTGDEQEEMTARENFYLAKYAAGG